MKINQEDVWHRANLNCKHVKLVSELMYKEGFSLGYSCGWKEHEKRICENKEAEEKT